MAVSSNLEAPPQINPRTDEHGNILLTEQEFQLLMAYLFKLHKYMVENI